MNKIITVLICVIVILGAMITAVLISRPNDNQEQLNVETQVAEENMLVETNAEEVKISPNCSFTVRTYYKECGHITSQYNNIPEELVNKTEAELKEMYPEYMVETFKSNEVIVYVEKEGECGEHYLVKDMDGKVVIYERLSDGTERLLEETSITTDYLPETDKISLRDGIIIFGREKLNSLIEDFE